MKAANEILNNKDKIKFAFSKAAKSYDTLALFQKELAEELLNSFVLPLTTDGEILPCKNDTFDIAASNLTYQWIGNLEGSFKEAYRILRPGGIFIFSTLAPETLKELRYCYAEASAKFNKDGLPPFMAFSEKQAIQSVLESVGFKNISIETTNMIKTYPDMWALLKTMKSIGAGNPFKDGDISLARGSILKKMAEIYEDRFKTQDSRFKTDNLQLTTHNCIYATYE